MDSQVQAEGPTATNDQLVSIADELLEHTRALRREHEELRDRLAGIVPAAADRPERVDGATAERPVAAAAAVNANGGPAPREPHGELYPMVLQMALAGEPREFALDQLAALEIDDADELVAEVYERVESQRAGPRRRLFSRRG
jgi:hypothetical protein